MQHHGNPEPLNQCCCRKPLTYINGCDAFLLYSVEIIILFFPYQLNPFSTASHIICHNVKHHGTKVTP